MNRKNASALLVNAVLPGTEALRSEPREISIETERLMHDLGHPIYAASHNDFTAIKYYYNEKNRPGIPKLAPASLHSLDQYVRSFKKLEVFAADCRKSVDSNIYSRTRVRWYWTDLAEAKAMMLYKKDIDAEQLDQIPAEEQDTKGAFKQVRERLECAKDCNLLVKVFMQADLFEVTSESLRAIIQDKDLGSQVVRRSDSDPRWDDSLDCSWANVLRLAFGVSCGRAMYEDIRHQCDQEIALPDHCRDDWDLDLGGWTRENAHYIGNNKFMPFAVHVLQKARGAAGMLIQYKLWGPHVAIWDMKKITLTDKKIIEEQAGHN